MAWLWRVMYWWAVPLLRVALRIKRVEGRQNVPKIGAAILASNHLSALDHVVLPAITKRTIYNISKAEHFEKPIKAWFMRNWGVVPLKRGAGDNAPLEKAKEILRSGELFCIYPEGTRSLNGKLHKGHTGVARIALEVGAPVIPIAMVGTFEAKPKGQKGINWGTPTGVIAGPPMDFSHYHGMQGDRDVCRKVTDEIMHAIAALGGQEYVDEYQYNPEVPSHARKDLDRAEDEDPAIDHRG
jgi:1-acyl-sn-glycerol-3-phosphate acyltransferase